MYYCSNAVALLLYSIANQSSTKVVSRVREGSSETSDVTVVESILRFQNGDLPSTGATLNAGVTLNTSLKLTLFSVKYFSRPRAVSY